MTAADWRTRISIDPAICRGRACVRGTRVLVSVVLDNLADGETVDAIVRAYPPVTAEDVAACLAYAAGLAHEETYALPESAA